VPCQLQSRPGPQDLLLIQPRITVRRIIQTQILLLQPLTPSQTLRNRLPRQLQMHSPQKAPMSPMHHKTTPQLRQNRAKISRLDPLRRAYRVPMHWVALPNHRMARRTHGFNMTAKERIDLGGAVAGNQCHFPDLLAGVDDVKKGDELECDHGWADFDADWIFEAAEEFDVRAVELTGAVADPEEVGRGGVVALGAGDDAVGGAGAVEGLVRGGG